MADTEAPDLGFRDRLSDLPESILLDILSCLPMEDVIATRCLSKRWLDLWRSVDSMDFRVRRFEDLGKVATLINKATALHSGSKIKTFRICRSNLESDHSRVDPWIRFAVDHHVERLDLDFALINDPSMLRLHGYSLHSLPLCLFECSSLTVLELNCCDLNLPPAFCFPSLKKVVLMNIEIADGAVMSLTSNSPVLEDLALENCNWTSNLKVSIVNQSIRKMKVVKSPVIDDEESVVDIYVPYLLHLELHSDMPVYYNIQDVSSVVTARLEFEHDDSSSGEFDDSSSEFDESSSFSMLAEIISALRQVKNLRLSSWCVETLVTGGSGSLAVQPSLLGNLMLLKLEVELRSYEYMSIDFLLRNSPALESFTISLARQDTESDFNDYQHGESELLDFSCLQHHLKRVIMEHFAGTNSEINLLKFLLRNSLVLKEIIIMVPTKFLTGSGQSYLEHCSRDGRFPEQYLEDIRDLLQSPRASGGVDILFHGSRR